MRAAIMHCDLPEENWYAKYMKDFTYRYLPDYGIDYALIFHGDLMPEENDIDLVDISEFCSPWHQEVALTYSIPIVCSTEEGSLNSLRGYLEKNNINTKFMLSRISHFIARTSWTRDMLILFGIDNNIITVIPYGADLSTFKPANKEPEEPSFLYVGSINKQKGVDILLNSYLKIMNKTDWKLKIVVGEFNNDTDLFTELKLLALKYEKIQLTSFPSSITDLPEYYHNASCFCHIQSYGNPLQFGTPFLWAISCGLPAISLDYGAARDYIKNGENGFLCRNTEEITEKMLAITKMDGKEMGKVSRGIAERNHNPKGIAERYKTVYEVVLKR